MLEIQSSLFVGRGLHRECYVHPENNDLCVKIDIAGESQETRREQEYYRHLKNRKINSEMLPTFHGSVDTNLGQGSIFDLVRDVDGQVSKSLQYYLASSDSTTLYSKALSRALARLKADLYRQRIITMTIKPGNILFKITSSTDGRLIIVDNIGNSDFLPICNYNTCLARKKILRKWNRFEHLLLKEFPANKVLDGFIRESRSMSDV